jgi:uncharacterized protein YeeX (DUF496 family)
VRRAATLLLVAVAALAAPASAEAVVIGIADQKPDMFADKRFGQLGIRHARLTVAWDALRYDWQRRELDAWMTAARKADVRPLLSFGPSREHRRVLPKPEELKWEFRQFRKRYPWAKTWATWNEANHCGMLLCHREKLAAAYYRKLRQECRSCTILAVELLDMPNMLGWVRKFRRHAKVEPKWWGLHNYVEANRFRTTSLKKLLRRVKGDVWLTEVGGIVKRRTKKRYTVKRIPESEAHALRVTRYIFREVVPLSRRITRVYLYHWNSSTTRDSWDSALIGADGRRRRAFEVVRSELRREKIRRLRAERRREAREAARSSR